jgi:hypothetical protein
MVLDWGKMQWSAKRVLLIDDYIMILIENGKKKNPVGKLYYFTGIMM